MIGRPSAIPRPGAEMSLLHNMSRATKGSVRTFAAQCPNSHIADKATMFIHHGCVICDAWSTNTLCQ